MKIGRTTRSSRQRLAEHNIRGIIGEIAQESCKPWQLLHYVPVTDASRAEAYLYETLGIHRFGKKELLRTRELDYVIRALVTCEFLDEEKYRVMLNGELRDYDVSELLENYRLAREHDIAERKRRRALKAAETRRRNAAKKDT